MHERWRRPRLILSIDGSSDHPGVRASLLSARMAEWQASGRTGRFGRRV